MSWKVAPGTVFVSTRFKPRVATVLRWVAHPPGAHPERCPLRRDVVALELQTRYGSRWYGVREARINSRLQMVVRGYDPRFEELCAWEDEQ